MHRAERLGIAAGLGTGLTGVGLILLTTGWGAVAAQVWVGLAAALLMFAVGGLVARPAWSRVKVSVSLRALGEAQRGAQTFKRTLIAENLLWIVALTAMVI